MIEIGIQFDLFTIWVTSFSGLIYCSLSSMQTLLKVKFIYISGSGFEFSVVSVVSFVSASLPLQISDYYGFKIILAT